MTSVSTTSALPRGPQPATEREQLAKVATQFEAIFVRQMLSQARQGGLGDELFGSQGGDTFRQMQDERFADIAAEKGMLGLAAAIEKQLAARLAPQPADKGN